MSEKLSFFYLNLTFFHSVNNKLLNFEIRLFVLQCKKWNITNYLYFNCSWLKQSSGVNFINLFMHSFYTCRSQKCKKLIDLTVFLAILRSYVKAARKMMVKLTQVNFIFTNWEFVHLCTIFAKACCENSNEIKVFLWGYNLMWRILSLLR